MRHDVPGLPAESQDPFLSLGAGYDAIGQLTFDGGGVGTATLVAPNKILTSARVFDGNFDGIIDLPFASISVLFGDDVATPDFVVGIDASDVQLNPKWVTDLIGQYDLAVLTLAADFDLIQPLGISDADPVGLEGTVAGYGLHGFGNGSVDLSDTFRRAATNTIDVYGPDVVEGTTLMLDFDSSAGGVDSFGLDVPTTLEGVGADGDGGGPLVANLDGLEAIVGVQSSGYNDFGDDYTYGDVSLYASFLDSDNASFLQSHGIDFASPPPVPEPSVFALMAIALGGIALRRGRGC